MDKRERATAGDKKKTNKQTNKGDQFRWKNNMKIL